MRWIRNQARTARRCGAAGTGVVIGLVLLGLLAGLTAWVYWTRGVQLGDPPASSAGPYDREAALIALDQTAVKVNAALAEPPVAAATEALVRDLVTRYPAMPEAHTLLAQVLLARDQAAAAYGALEQALELSPRPAELPPILELAGTVAVNLGRLDVAAEHFGRAVALEPGSTRYRLSLANVHLKQGRLDAAAWQLEQVIVLDAGEHRAYALLSDVAAQHGNLPAALRHIARALEQTPDDDRRNVVTYTRKRALLLRRADQPGQALQVLDSLHPIEQQQVDVLADLAGCWAALEQPGRAAEVYEQAFAKDPANWRLLAEAARWHNRAADQTAVMRCLAIIRSLNPHAPVLDELGAGDIAPAAAPD